MIEGLPIEAATFRDDRPSWTQQDELLAINAEVADAWGRAIVQSNASKRIEFGEPLRIKHPDRPEAEPRKTKRKSRLATAADIAKERG